MKKLAIRLIGLGLVISTLVLVSCEDAGAGSDSGPAPFVAINPLNSQKPGELATTEIKVSWEPTKISGVTKDVDGNAANAGDVELELYYTEVALGGAKPSVSEVLAGTKYTGGTLAAASTPVAITGLNNGKYYYVVIKNITAGDTSNLVYKYTTYKTDATDLTKYAPTTNAALKNVVGDEITAQGDNADLNIINTSAVTDMSKVFQNNTTFNGDVSRWDVSKATTFNSMFSRASAFSGDLSQWQIGNGVAATATINMDRMFYFATSFNSDIKDWDVSRVDSFVFAFAGTSIFSGDLSQWKIGENLAAEASMSMSFMFAGAEKFSSDISQWDVSKVTRMEALFYQAKIFNSDIKDWDVSNVITMGGMFYQASAFNQNLENWKSKITKVESWKDTIDDKYIFQESGLDGKEPSWCTNTVVAPATTVCKP